MILVHNYSKEPLLYRVVLCKSVHFQNCLLSVVNVGLASARGEENPGWSSRRENMNRQNILQNSFKAHLFRKTHLKYSETHISFYRHHSEVLIQGQWFKITLFKENWSKISKLSSSYYCLSELSSSFAPIWKQRWHTILLTLNTFSSVPFKWSGDCSHHKARVHGSSHFCWLPLPFTAIAFSHTAIFLLPTW